MLPLQRVETQWMFVLTRSPQPILVGSQLIRYVSYVGENLKSPIPADLYNNCFCPLMTFNNGNPLNHTNAISERNKAPLNEYRVRFVRPSTELSPAKKSSFHFIDTKD